MEEDYEDAQPEDLFSLNNVELTVKHLSPKKKQPLKKPPQMFPGALFTPLQQLESNVISPSKSQLILWNSQSLHISSFRETAVWESQITTSPIHLSEFEQPPQSTSTPVDELLHCKGANIPSVTRITTPFDKRPLAYSEPMFRFDLNDISSSFIDSDHSVLSSGMYPLDATDSPLHYKSMKQQSIQTDISGMINNMKESLSIHHDYQAEEARSDTDPMIIDQSQLPIANLGDISVVQLNTTATSTPRSIMKTSGSNRSRSTGRKKVCIDESVQLITPLPRRKRPRCSSPPISKSLAKKSKSLSYHLMFELCMNDKDPLNILG